MKHSTIAWLFFLVAGVLTAAPLFAQGLPAPVADFFESDGPIGFWWTSFVAKDPSADGVTFAVVWWFATLNGVLITAVLFVIAVAMSRKARSGRRVQFGDGRAIQFS